MTSSWRSHGCPLSPGQADLVPLNRAAPSPGLSPVSAQTARRSVAEAGLYTQLPLSFLLRAHVSLLCHLRIKAGAHSSFSHQAFITKKVPELPSHPLQPSPRGLGASPSAGWVCCGGNRLSHGGWLLTGTEWVIFFRALGLGGGVSLPGLPVLWNSPFQCCGGSPWGPLPGSSAQAAAIHSWRVISFLIYKSFFKKKNGAIFRNTSSKIK